MRPLLAAAVAVLAVALTMTWGSAVRTAHAATIAGAQCNSDENLGAAGELDCTIDVVNNINAVSGVTSSTVTTTICQGAPGAALCGLPVVSITTDVVGSVSQCNSSLNPGGSTIICNVTVTNNITVAAGADGLTPATVNQCIGTGGGGGTTVTCTPVSSTTAADIDQCNGSANGGDSTVICDVLTSTTSSAWPITVSQCNLSVNGGGDTVRCSAQITNLVVALPPDDSTTTTSATTTTSTPAATTTTVDTGTDTSVPGNDTTLPGNDTTLPGTATSLPSQITLPFTGATNDAATTPPNITLPVTGSHASSTAAAATIVLTAGIATLLVLPRIPRRRRR